MQFEPFDFDVMVHSKLGDDPNVDNNMTADDLKARFDSPMVAFKEWINAMLVPRLNSFLPEYSVESVNGLFGKVVLRARDILTNSSKTIQQELDEKVAKEDALSLEEIMASAALLGKIPDAAAVKEMNTFSSASGTFNTAYTWSNYTECLFFKYGHVVVCTLRALQCDAGVPRDERIVTVPAGFVPRTTFYSLNNKAKYGNTLDSSVEYTGVADFSVNQLGNITHRMGSGKIYTAYASFVYYV